MSKEEVVKLLVLIELVYPNCILKNETVQQWFQFCTDMDYEKVLTKLKKHIRNSPFPPAFSDISVFNFEENYFPATLLESITTEIVSKSNKRAPEPVWLSEYSTRKS
jgi:hypothetical protein